MSVALVGREEELDAIGAFVQQIEGGPAALVLSGEAGIGKTALWQAGVDEARTRRDSVLTCQGVAAEASFAFAGLTELLGSIVDEVLPALVPRRRRALEVALQLAEPGEVAPDAHVIGLALLDVLRGLAEDGPLLVALDDVQWIDAASVSALHIAVRRLRAERIGLLMTVRPPAKGTVLPELERCFPAERLTRLELRPLSLAAVHRLLEQQIGLELRRGELVQVHRAAEGNPFFALELGRELARSSASETEGRVLRIPKSLHELLGGRLARLPAETTDVLLAAAALARPTVSLLAATYDDECRVIEALEAGAAEGVIDLDGTRVRFSHPLLASVCYEQAPVWKRRAVHRALGATVDDAEERARHLALGADGPDERIATALDRAAEHAAGRGAPMAAGELSELAAELTEGDAVAARGRRVRAARFYDLAGDSDWAAALLVQLLAEVPSGSERSEILLARVFTLRGDTSTLVALCDEAFLAAQDDESRKARILALRAWVHLMAADVNASLAAARKALELADKTGDPALIGAVIARLAQAESWGADVTPGLLERGAEMEDRLGLALDWRESCRLYLPRLLMRQGEIDRPRVLLEELTAAAATHGHESTRIITLWYLSMLEWLAGRWQRALEHSSSAVELYDAGTGTMDSGWPGRVVALLQTDLGLVDEARATAEEALAYSRARSNEIFALVILGVLGRRELVIGRIEAAAEYLRDLPDRLLRGGVNDPTLPVWADAIETLVAVGEVDLAGRYLERYEANARRLGSPWATSAAARCQGLISAAERDFPGAFASFEEALAEPAARYPLEHARALLCLGAVRRQAKQKRAAREALEQALATFDQLGARLWAEKARAELRRISGRRAPTEELTETEERVARLAAQGRTNKEIAAELYMGQSTVEAHLSRVYQKLGVRRAELATRLLAGDEISKPVVDATQV
jgi:DNA-binding CsgD family transcriptional regulator